MSALHFAANELSAALARGVRQCVVIGSPAMLRDALKNSWNQTLQVFAVGEEQPLDLSATFVPTEFASETLGDALEKSDFDKLKASLFVWLGDASYRTVDAAIAALAFIASLPEGTGVLLDYAVERPSLGAMTHTALDALTSRIVGAGSSVQYMIQPQAVTAMLRSLGFGQIEDLAREDPGIGSGRLVSAVV